jgi:putative ABC transport system ATP-binding protein
MMENDYAIETQDVKRIYESVAGTVQALKSINLQIISGQLVALKGRSGSGKTTLLNCLGGLDNPTRGKIRVYGAELGEMDDGERTQWRRRHVGFIFQAMGLLPTFSSYENLDMMLRMARVPRSERHERIFDYLERMGMVQWVNHRPSELSGGQQQRIAIARALVTQPRLILADEPTSELDSETTHHIMEILHHTVAEQGTTILVSTHDPIVDEYADTVFHLRDGVIAT